MNTQEKFGTVHDTVTGSNLIFGVLESSIFNMGVSIFMFISGYFGMSGDSRKVIKMECVILFYSLASECISQLISGISFKNIIVACLPVFGNRYWFISAYILILVFSNYINLLFEKTDKKWLARLLLLMVWVFNIVPTIIQKDITGNKGKGPLNLLVVYMLGRYVKKYIDGKYKIPYLKVALCSLIIEFFLNICLTFILGGVGVKASFARDYSIFILIAAICVFMLFKEMTFYSKTINSIASHVISIYLFESAVREFIKYYIFDLVYLENTFYLPLVVVIEAVLISAICIIIDFLRSLIFSRIEEMGVSRLVGVLYMVTSKIHFIFPILKD